MNRRKEDYCGGMPHKKEDYCGGMPHKKEDVVEGYGGRFQGCAYSTGDYNVMGNPALCGTQFIGNMPASYVHNAMVPSVKENYCGSCSGGPKGIPESYRKEMMKGAVKEPYCDGCGSRGDYNVFNYDMVENFTQSGETAAAVGNMDFPPPWVMVPHQFVNNMKLSIEDPDNRYTYWLGGSPCPCKSGPNEASPRRNWFGVNN